jgi:hypothetical protein
MTGNSIVACIFLLCAVSGFFGGVGVNIDKLHFEKVTSFMGVSSYD